MEMMNSITVAVSLFILTFLAALCHTQMLHSIDRMEEAVKSQSILAEQLFNYIRTEEKRLKQLELTVRKLRAADSTKVMERDTLEGIMGNPVKVFRFVTDIYTDVENVRLNLNPAPIPEELTKLMTYLPSNLDYTSAVQSIVRLQEMYEEQADFTHPKSEATKDVLTAFEVFDIGKISIDEGNYHGALINMKRARDMFLEQGDIDNAMIALDYLAFALNEQGNPDYALNYTYDLLTYYKFVHPDPDAVERLQNNMALYTESLGGYEHAIHKIKLEHPYISEPVDYFENYKELCRGETIKIPEMNKTRELKCHLITNNHPLLLLAPAKYEELSEEAGLSYYHDVLSDREIELFKHLASDKFENSELVKEELPVDKNDSFSFLDTKVRASNTGWILDEDDDRIRAISNRVSAMTGLDLASAEAFQVLSYGVGGFYLPHYDYDHDKHPNPFPDYGGDRIATWIFYFNNILKGGATVFPQIGATVWPKKGGAAFWWNLYRSGEGNLKTLHAACPVLEGYKWASNKWFHEHGNEFTRPCGLNANS